MKRKLLTVIAVILTHFANAQVQKWEDWQNNLNVVNGNAISSSTSRNIGLNFWYDRGFGAELHYHIDRWGTALYTRHSGEAIWLGNYNSDATEQWSFNPWMTLTNSNVGIGTTNPITPLSVVGANPSNQARGASNCWQ